MRNLWRRIVAAIIQYFPFEPEANVSRLDRMDGVS